MSELADRLEAKTRKEIRYARGMEVMQRERYVEYCHDLGKARQQGDARRTREIIQDLSAFARETRDLMHAHQRALARLLMIRCGQESALPPPRSEVPLSLTATLHSDLAEGDDAAARFTGADRLAGGLEAVRHPFPVTDDNDRHE
jgi:hypothetical protein